MADNVPVTAGTGTDIATDDVGGVHYQRVKLDLGGDGLADPAIGTVPVSGTVAVTNSSLTTIAGAVHIEDDPVASGASGALVLGVRNDAGTVLAGTTGDAIPLSMDSGGRVRVHAVGPVAEDSGISGNPVAVGVKASAAAPTDMTADGDVVHPWALRNGSQVVNLASGGTLVDLGQEAMAASLPVVIASNQTVIPVSDNAGSLTVDGTVTANLAAGTNNIGDVDVLSLPALPAGTNNIGDVDVLTLPARTISNTYAAASAFTIGLETGPLASDTNLVAGREGTAVTFTAKSVAISGKITTGTTPTASRQIQVWFYASGDDGTLYSGGATGSNANLTPSDKTQMRLLTVIFTDGTSDKTYNFGPIYLENIFGQVPKKGGPFVVHNTGVALNSTGSNHAIKYEQITLGEA